MTPRPRVVVIDDDVVARMVLRHLIDSCGEFDVVEAADGAVGWRLLDDEVAPALCFCDLHLPHFSGLQLLARVQESPRLRSMPFVLMSADGAVATSEQASRAGASAYLRKPFEFDAVRAQLVVFVPCTEAPALAAQRLGIDSERLLLYLTGLQQQVLTAQAGIGLVAAETVLAPVQLRRLHQGCITLGLHGAAAALAALNEAPVTRNNAAAALALVLRSVTRQMDLLL